jgi:hypothetical protein
MNTPTNFEALPLTNFSVSLDQEQIAFLRECIAMRREEIGKLGDPDPMETAWCNSINDEVAEMLKILGPCCSVAITLPNAGAVTRGASAPPSLAEEQP